MKAGIICFTARGTDLCLRLSREWKKIGIDSEGYVPARFWKEEWRSEGIYPRECPLSQWAQTMFQERRPLVFVGAAGIAVRAIAPFVRDKFTDPPVLVIDEGGTFCIPLLSGHVGGANRLARQACQCLGAIPVITTATDVNGLFAVDEFAVSNGLIIADREEAKQISSCLLEGEPVGYFCDPEAADERKWSPPPGCIGRFCAHNIWITYKRRSAFLGTGQVLRLIPRCLILGIGCRRGVEPHVLEQCVMSVLEDHDIDPQSVRLLATIDRKKEERAIMTLSETYGWPVTVFTAEELKQVPGEFSESPFVRQTVGVGNVCERSAVAAGGRLIVHKTAGEGVTVAAAIYPL